MFMQTLGGGWPAIVKQGRFALPYSKQAKACYVDYRDVAEVAAITLTEDKLNNGTFELCAPGMVNRVELAVIMSEALGETIEAGELPFDQWAQGNPYSRGASQSRHEAHVCKLRSAWLSGR